jgi:hypothetical protein
MIIRPKQLAQDGATNYQVIGVPTSIPAGTPAAHAARAQVNFGGTVWNATEVTTTTSASIIASSAFTAYQAGKYLVIAATMAKVGWNTANSEYSRWYLVVGGVTQTESYKECIYTSGVYFSMVVSWCGQVNSGDTIAFWHQKVTAGSAISSGSSIQWIRIGLS